MFGDGCDNIVDEGNQGSGFGTVGRMYDSITRGPAFKSSHIKRTLN